MLAWVVDPAGGLTFAQRLRRCSWVCEVRQVRPEDSVAGVASTFVQFLVADVGRHRRLEHILERPGRALLLKALQVEYV